MKTVKKIYVNMSKFKIKQNEHVNKMKLNNGFSKKLQIAADLNGIMVKCNGAVALRWNDNSETWNKEAEWNIWFWLRNLSRRLGKHLWKTHQNGFFRHSITRIWKKNTKIRNRHRNQCSTATGKICGSLRTKLYFEIAL